jgi:propionate CoA-transferase
MSFVQQMGLQARLARWALALARRNTRFPSPVPDNPKFMTPRDAVQLIRDRDVVAASGLGMHHRASILYQAVREVFAEVRHPCQLTLLNVGGHGNRGLLPGSLDDLARPGLCTRFITSHFETCPAFLDLAQAGECELQCLPLGILALLFDRLGHGKDSVLSDTGVGTFLDPRTGRGSPVTAVTGEQLVSVEGDRLRYRIPRIDVALFNLPAADRHGNLYAMNCAMIGDSYEIAHAAKRNGGAVIANVGLLVDEGYDRVFLPARMVDAVVYYPDTEQTVGFFHRDPWTAVTLASTAHIADALQHADVVSWLAEFGGGVARRTALDAAVVRLAAATLLAHVPRGADVALGVGLPEQIGRVVFEHGCLDDLTFLVESGVIGGVPAPGAYFGAAFSPRIIVSTAELFARCYRHLDAACLGALQVDSAGNVNVSKRGPGVRNYAGPGGHVDFTTAAHTLVFVSGWMRGGAMSVENGAVCMRTAGTPKFIDRVDEVSFNGQQALRVGKQVFYVTPVGVFHLTRRGLELVQMMPGIDVRRDILDLARAKIVLPASAEVPIISSSIVTGAGFDLPATRHGVTTAHRRAAAA